MLTLLVASQHARRCDSCDSPTEGVSLPASCGPHSKSPLFLGSSLNQPNGRTQSNLCLRGCRGGFLLSSSTSALPPWLRGAQHAVSRALGAVYLQEEWDWHSWVVHCNWPLEGTNARCCGHQLSPSQVKEQHGLLRPRFLLKKRLSRAFLHQPLLASMLEDPLDLPVRALRGCSRQTAQTAGTWGASLARKDWFLSRFSSDCSSLASPM